MKTQNTLLPLLILMVTLPCWSITTPASVAFANSYLQRATGIEASYLNPANINSKPMNKELQFLNFATGFSNNFASLEPMLYDDGHLLTQKEKNAFLKDITNSAMLNVHTQVILAGFSYNMWSFSTASNAYGYGRFHKDYFKLALNGNTEEVRYNFSKKTDFATLVYQDLTVGYGGVALSDFFPELMEGIPEILVGISGSFLFGGVMYDVDKYSSTLAIEYPGTTLNQYIVIRDSSIGSGLKMNLGLSSQVYNFDDDHYITAGTSFDNLLGFIYWRNVKLNSYLYNGDFNTKKFEYTETNEDSDYSGNPHTTQFPITFRLGSKYVYQATSVSLDYEQNLWKHPAFSYDPQVSLGFEQLLYQKWPIQLGYRLPIGDFVSAYSIGTGYRGSKVEFGLSLQFDKAPHIKYAKGMSFGLFTKIHYD